MHWIPTNMDLPTQPQEPVLVTRRPTQSELEKDSEYIPIIIAAITEDHRWYDFDSGEDINLAKWVVSHWMPLPEPASVPKEDCVDH